MPEKRLWTAGEVNCFIAEWFSMDPDEIKHFVILAVPRDIEHMGVPIQHNMPTPYDAVELMKRVIAAPPKIMEPDQDWWTE